MVFLFEYVTVHMSRYVIVSFNHLYSYTEHQGSETITLITTANSELKRGRNDHPKFIAEKVATHCLSFSPYLFHVYVCFVILFVFYGGERWLLHAFCGMQSI